MRPARRSWRPHPLVLAIFATIGAAGLVLYLQHRAITALQSQTQVIVRQLVRAGRRRRRPGPAAHAQRTDLRHPGRGQPPRPARRPHGPRGPQVRRRARGLPARRALLRLAGAAHAPPPPTCCSTAAPAGSSATPRWAATCSTWPAVTPGRSRSTSPPRASGTGPGRCSCACSGPTPGASTTSPCSASSSTRRACREQLFAGRHGAGLETLLARRGGELPLQLRVSRRARHGRVRDAGARGQGRAAAVPDAVLSRRRHPLAPGRRSDGAALDDRGGRPGHWRGHGRQRLRLWADRAVAAADAGGARARLAGAPPLRRAGADADRLRGPRVAPAQDAAVAAERGDRDAADGPHPLARAAGRVPRHHPRRGAAAGRAGAARARVLARAAAAQLRVRAGRPGRAGARDGRCLRARPGQPAGGLRRAPDRPGAVRAGRPGGPRAGRRQPARQRRQVLEPPTSRCRSPSGPNGCGPSSRSPIAASASPPPTRSASSSASTACRAPAIARASAWACRSCASWCTRRAAASTCRARSAPAARSG